MPVADRGHAHSPPLDDQRHRASRATLALCVGSATALLMLSNFDFGFRATADQIDYTCHALTLSLPEWFGWGLGTAKSQGRVGQLVSVPLEYFGAVIGDMWFYPTLCIAILATIVGGFAAWLQMLTRSPIAICVVAVYLALLPLGLHHWLPNAYPMQFLPLACALILRAALLRSYQAGRPRLWLTAVCAVAIFIAAASYEISLTLLAMMAALEAVLHVRSRDESSRLPRAYVVLQGAIVALALATYVGFRLIYPSSYEGNQLPVDPASAALATGMRHLLFATSIPEIRKGNWRELHPAPQLGAAILVWCGLGLAVYFGRPQAKDWKLYASFGVALALASTLPIAANHKYIDWCLRVNECAYIDGRFSLLGIATAVVFLAAAAQRLRWFWPIFAYLVGVLGGFTYLTDDDARHTVKWISSGETMAKALVCQGGDEGALIPTLVALPIPFHPQHDDAYKAAYWRLYIDHLRESRFWRCP
jgi:hypothetical protein